MNILQTIAVYVGIPALIIGVLGALTLLLGAWRDGGRPGLAIVIGGADGLDPSVRARADLVFAFGAATLPHGLVRVLALEQLYRAMTILSGHPYHRGAP